MSICAELLCFLRENHVAAGFAKDEVEEGQEACVDNELDPVDPTPVETGLDCATDERTEGDSNDTGHAKDAEWDAAFAVAFPDVGDGAALATCQRLLPSQYKSKGGQRRTDQIDSNRARPASKKSRHQYRSEVRTQRRRDQPNAKQHVGAKVSRQTTCVLRQRNKEQWEYGGAHVPRHKRKAQVWEVRFVNVPLL